MTITEKKDETEREKILSKQISHKSKQMRDMKSFIWTRKKQAKELKFLCVATFFS